MKPPMLIHELSEEECREVLKRTNLARLACSRHDQPYIVPIHFDFDGGSFYSFSTVGQKIDWMRANPKVCVEVDEITDKSQWTTVIVFGRYQELTDASADRAARNRARELFEKRREWWLPAAGKLASSEHPVPVVFRIRIERMTGRRVAKQ
jgi:nitroimidazol reductase NimA-like FMN-containing flavoprotein (pyridoxamine 5'-phosphate oxidase superfamily)